MKKLALIRKEKKSQWKSCQSITHSLSLSYESLKGPHLEVDCYDFPQGAQAFEALLLAERLIHDSVTHIIFIDHEPHPCQLIKALKQSYSKGESSTAELIFHLFGDFVLQSQAWRECEEALKSFSTTFICASHKQKELVDKLLSEDCRSLVIPFALEESSIEFDQNQRGLARKRLDLGEAYTFVYTGRLSYQKNVLDLIHAFVKLKETITGPVKLLLAGPMDDLGAPYLGKEGIAGTFFYHWEEVLRGHPSLIQGQDLQYLGNLDSAHLRDLYLASDAYISLSAHNDEDYGISPAEALAYGLPAILSSWGGFISFKSYFENQVQLCPLQLGSRRHKCSHAQVFKSMLFLLSQAKGSDERLKRSREVLDLIGHINIGSRILNEVLEREGAAFAGFSETFVKLASVFETSPSAPFRGADAGFSQFYLSLYEDYAKALK